MKSDEETKEHGYDDTEIENLIGKNQNVESEKAELEKLYQVALKEEAAESKK